MSQSAKKGSKKSSSSSSSSDSDEKKKKKKKKKKKDPQNQKPGVKKPKRTPVEKAFRVFYKIDKKNYPSLWTTQSYVHIFAAVVHLLAASYLLVLYIFVYRYISLYDGYEGTSLTFLMMSVSGAGVPVSILSGLLTCHFMTQKRLGRSRFQMFFATGSSAVLALSSFILIIICLGSFLTAANYFQAGFYLNMQKYHEIDWVRESIASMQEKFECCGNNNYTDWFMVMWSPLVTSSKVGIPLSCCKKQAGLPCVEVAELEELSHLKPYHEGCNAKVQSAYIMYLLIACFFFTFSLIVDVITTGLAYINSKAATSHENLIFEDRMKIIPQKLRANRLMRAKRNKIMRSG